MYAAWRLANLLTERGDLDEAAQILRALTDSGDKDAARRLISLLADRGDLDEAAQIVRALTADDMYAVIRQADLVTDRDDLGWLRIRADAGDEDAASRLANLLAEQDRMKKRSGRAGSA